MVGKSCIQHRVISIAGRYGHNSVEGKSQYQYEDMGFTIPRIIDPENMSAMSSLQDHDAVLSKRLWSMGSSGMRKERRGAGRACQSASRQDEGFSGRLTWITEAMPGETGCAKFSTAGFLRSSQYAAESHAPGGHGTIACLARGEVGFNTAHILVLSA